MTTDTIAAIATPPGRGGIGIIRLSGPKSVAIAQHLSQSSSLEPRSARFVTLYDTDASPVDEGIMLYFKAPHSFTGEDVVELQVHGSPVVLDRLLQLSVELGARLARPGEFSERAFLNDKLDLAQAEAIADLIHAHSLTAARMAIRSLRGEFSEQINRLNNQIIQLRMYVEAAIDFPEEEIDFLNDGKISTELLAILQTLSGIQASANQGVLMREGLSVVIAGRPNAGKSTLINRLAGWDVAIVTDIPGTTRDVMREHVVLDGIPLHLIDTAGLRESDDVVEQEGIKRAWSELGRADLVLLVMDMHRLEEQSPLNWEVQQKLPQGVPLIRVFNKIDLVGESPSASKNDVYLCAKSGEGMVHLKEKIKQIAGYQPIEGGFLARRRHLDALQRAHAHVTNGLHQLNVHRAGELLAEDLRAAHHDLSEITGEFTSDDLLGEIFSRFCIGK